MSGMVARVLTGALEAWIGLLEVLGARGTHWEWRKRAWRQGLEARLAHWENASRGVSAPTRMCPSCRALVMRSERLCPACGESMRGVPGGGIARALALVFPGVPSVSVLIVSANVAMSLFMFARWGSGGGGGLLGFLSPPGDALYLLGAKYAPAIVAGEWWRLVTANYLHGGLLHLFFNGYALMTLGPLVEEAFGWRKFFCLYTLSGTCGFVASSLWHPMVLSIGASGAIYGLLGFAVVYGRYRAGPSGRALAAHLSQWLMYGLLMFFIPGIDSAAHVGGLIPGALLALVLDPREPRTAAGNAWLWALTALALLATFGSFIAMGLAYPENVRMLSK